MPDEDGNGGDDTADCLRYLVATKSRIVAQRKLRFIASGDLGSGGIGLGLAGGPKCLRQLEFLLVLVENSC